MIAERYRVAVVGARRQRQGTGEYVAREFARLGCEVRAIVGTTEATTEAARRTLFDRYGIECKGFPSLQRLLGKESVDIVAVCSPADTHLPQLELAVDAGCHVFCEKPLWWEAELTRSSSARAEIHQRAGRLLERFLAQRRYLALNTQWPFTLQAFRELHADAYGEGLPVEQFGMWLSPTSKGSDMVVDAGPHLISMLQALTGPGTLHEIRAQFRNLPALGERAGLLLTCVYEYAGGEVQVEFTLTCAPDLPRPAGYSINGRSVKRHVELPNYMISFKNSGKRVSVPDPLAAAVEDFVRSVRTQRRPERASVVDGMTQLHELVVATQLRERL